MKIKDEKGYSLVEMLVVIAIFAIVGTIIVGFLTTSLRAFTGSKNEINAQAEAQTTVNWLNDMLVEAGYGITYKEDAGAGLNTLEIYNANNIYTITYVIANKELTCEESQLQNDGSRLVLTSSQLLAENVSAFSVDTSTLTDENPIAVLTLHVDKDGRTIELVRNVMLRNGVKVNKTIDEVYDGVATVVSSVNEVMVYPTESYHARGTSVQFSARVTGVGFPSQVVRWSIANPTGLQPGTQIDPNTGVLTIDPYETVSSFRVVAESVDTDTDGNTVQSADTCGIVTVMTIDYIEIANLPSATPDVGTAFTLNAIVHGDNLNELGSSVTWSIPEGDRKEGLSISSNGTVILGMQLYNAFPTQTERDSAKIKVRATSVADPNKFTECEIPINFQNLSIDFDNIVYQLNRNDYLDLSAKLSSAMLTNKNMTLVWSLDKDAGLGSKIHLDRTTGIISADKDIDYNSEYTLTVKVSMMAPGETTPTSEQTVSVYIPKVSITMDPDTCSIQKGSSGRIPFMVNGLKATADDMQVASAPAVRNTLLYVQGNELVVSVGMDVSVSQFTTILSMKSNSGIAQYGTVLVGRQALSDDELSTLGNVEDVYVHAPVPGKEDTAPSMDAIQNATNLFTGSAVLRNWAALEAERTTTVGGNANVTDMTKGSYIYVEYTGSSNGIDLVFQDWDATDGYRKIEPSATGSAGNRVYYAIYKYEDIVDVFGSDFSKADAVCISGRADTVTIQRVDLVLEGNGGTTNCLNGSYKLSNWTNVRMAYTVASGMNADGADAVVTDITSMKDGEYVYVTYTGTSGELDLIVAEWNTGRNWIKVAPSETGSLQNRTYYSKFYYADIVRAFGSDLENADDLHICARTAEITVKTADIVILGGKPTYPSLTLPNGAVAVYYYDYARDRMTMTINSDARYYYTAVAGSDIVWYRSNVENEYFYVPVPGEPSFPTQFSAAGEASITYRGEDFTYMKSVSATGKTIYYVFDKVTSRWYQYDASTNVWVQTDVAFNG